VEWMGGTTGVPWHEWELNALPVFTSHTIAVDSFGELTRACTSGMPPPLRFVHGCTPSLFLLPRRQDVVESYMVSSRLV